MKNYKKSVNVVKTTTTSYELTKDTFYVVVDVDGINYEPKLKTTKKINDFNISVLYDIDTELLKTENPFMSNSNTNWNKIMKTEIPLPSIEDIDTSKLFYCDHANYSIYDSNMNKIHLPQKIDYIGSRITNENYDLEKVLEHLKKHPNILEVSDILKIPYYNATEDCNRYLEITVLPDDSFYDESKGYLPKYSLYYNLQNTSWSNYDPLNIKQFSKNTKTCV